MIDTIDIVSYADDSTPYGVCMKTNQDKCYFLSSLDISTKFLQRACILENSDSQKRLGLTINRELDFNKHVTNQKSFKRSQEFSHIYPKHKSDF